MGEEVLGWLTEGGGDASHEPSAMKSLRSSSSTLVGDAAGQVPTLSTLYTVSTCCIMLYVVIFLSTSQSALRSSSLTFSS